jgi:parvulin-like peptidyl-prolyl cis-trans isomerase-like protein
MTKCGILLVGGILGCLMSTLPGWAQGDETPVPSSKQVANEPVPNQEQGAASDAVITIHGLCDPGKQGAPSEQPGADEKSCTNVVTREAFEALVNSMNVTNKTLSPETRRNLAETYAEYLALERVAVQAKLDDTPQFAEIMRWWRLRTLADMYRGALRAQFAHPSAEEVHAYYTERLASYDRIRVERVMVPRAPTESDEKSENKSALEMAQAARERIAKGENTTVVQKDIYTQLKLGTPPVTNVGSFGRSNFPKDEVDELFSLQPGEVSKVEKEASYVIYKIKSKETLSEESQKEQLSREIAQQKFSDTMRAVNESAKPEFNDTYLGPHVIPAPRPHESAMTSPHQ